MDIALIFAAYDSITSTLQNNLDNSRYNADNRKEFIINEIDHLIDISDNHNQHIVDMVSYLDLIRSKIKEIFEYYQQSIQTFLLISTLFLGIIVSLVLTDDIKDDSFLALWGGVSLLFSIIPIVEMVFLSIWTAYHASYYVHFSSVEKYQFQYKNKIPGLMCANDDSDICLEEYWLGTFDKEKFTGISKKIEWNLLLFFISMNSGIVCILHYFFKSNTIYETPVFVIGILLTILLTIRFIFFYGYILDFDMLNNIQSTFNIPTTTEGGLDTPILQLVGEYNYHQEYLFCQYLKYKVNKKVITHAIFKKLREIADAKLKKEPILNNIVIKHIDKTKQKLEKQNKRLLRLLQMDTYRYKNIKNTSEENYGQGLGLFHFAINCIKFVVSCIFTVLSVLWVIIYISIMIVFGLFIPKNMIPTPTQIKSNFNIILGKIDKLKDLIDIISWDPKAKKLDCLKKHEINVEEMLNKFNTEQKEPQKQQSNNGSWLFPYFNNKKKLRFV